MPEELGAEKVRGRSVDISKEEAPQISVYGASSLAVGKTQTKSSRTGDSPSRKLTISLAPTTHGFST